MTVWVCKDNVESNDIRVRYRLLAGLITGSCVCKCLLSEEFNIFLNKNSKIHVLKLCPKKIQNSSLNRQLYAQLPVISPAN